MSSEGPLLLDGDPKSPLEVSLPLGAPLLGRDPFEASSASEPWLEALDRLTARIGVPNTASVPVRPAAPPLVSEVPDGALPKDGVGRWLRDPERRRIAALRAALAGREDPFGLDVSAVERALPIMLALYRFWFRVQSEGHEQLPRRGGAILVANHGGLLPFDGAMAALDVMLHSDPPRLLRPLVARFVRDLPVLRDFYAGIGPVIGTRQNFRSLLEQRQLVLVFPEGVDGIRKTMPDRYRLQHFHPGFAEEAVRHRVPVIPVAIVGPDDQAPILYDVKTIARWLKLPAFPITPTFPWLGPLGLLPYPVRYRIVYGEPLALYEQAPREAADDRPRMEEMAARVRQTVQHLVDRHR
jgi:1-acyl-sn-glycerol-3-phosphate acyltransferase